MCRIVRPTFSMSVVRNDFWTLAARGYGGSCWPRKYGLNWTIPAVVSSSEGSFGISEEEGTTVCPRSSKKERNARRMSAPRIEASVAAADQASPPPPPHPHRETPNGHGASPPPDTPTETPKMDTDATHGPGAPAAAGAPGVLEAFLARSSEAVLVTDHHGRITMINPPGERLLGYELGGPVGQPVQELFPGRLPSPERPDGGPERPWREGELTVRGRRRDGSEIPLQVSVTYPDHGGGYASVV